MTKQQRSETIVREWNERNPVGTKVVVYAVGAGPIEPHVGETTSSAWVLCREPVISVSGLAGSISLDRVRVQIQEPKTVNKYGEPWDRDGAAIFTAGEKSVDVAMCVEHYVGRVSAVVNADRIVECVNACAGVENPAALPELLEAVRVLCKGHMRDSDDNIYALKCLFAKLKN